MFPRTKAPHILALELSSSSLKGVELKKERQLLKVERIFECNLSPPFSSKGDVKPLDIEEGTSFSSLAEQSIVATTLAASEVFIRPLEIGLKKERDIQEVFPFQAEPILPYPLERAVLNKIKLTQKGNSTQFTLCSIRKESLKTHLEACQSLGIEPEIVSATQNALASFSHNFFPHQKMNFVLHVGKEETVCVFLREGKLVASHVIPSGSNAIEIEVQREQLSSAITQAIYAIEKQEKNKELAPIVITGEITPFPLSKLLCQDLKNPLIMPEVSPDFNLSIEQTLAFAVPIGLALSFQSKEPKINFRQGEFAYPKPWKRLRQPLLTYLSLAFALTCSVCLFFQSLMGKQEDLLKEKYAHLLSTMDKTYDSFEAEYFKKTGTASEPSFQKPLKKLTLEDLSGRIHFLEKQTKTTQDTFPLQPNIPRASDVFAWLSTHPNVVQKEEHGTVPLLQIESLSYAMVKHPDFRKKQEKYQVKVEIEFTSPTPKLAREFHDALIAPNDFVDPKGEIKWSSQKNKYKTSFFLKDKTLYSS